MNTTTEVTSDVNAVRADLNQLINDAQKSLSEAAEDEVLPIIELLQQLIDQRQRLRDAVMVHNSQLFLTLGQKVDELSAHMNRDVIGSLLRRTRTFIEVATGVEPTATVVEGSIAGDLSELLVTLGEIWDNLLDQVPAIVEHGDPDSVVPVITGTGSLSRSESKRKIAQSIVAAGRQVGIHTSLLGAIGWIETKLVNSRARPDRNHPTEGVFQFMPKVWDIYVERVGEALGVSSGDRRKVDAQALIASVALKSYRTELVQAGVATEPKPGNLYMAHLLGVPAAIAVLKADTGNRVNEVLRTFYAQTRLGADFADKIMEANPLLSGNDTPLSVGVLRERMDAMVLRAMAVFDEHLDRVETPIPAFPSWYKTADRERALGVAEVRGPEHHPQILKYLATTSIWSDLDARKDETHWCAAFVNWCLKEAGVKGTRLANARSFLNWQHGIRLDGPALGCIVVMWRNSPDATEGHVGFYAGDGSGGLFDMLGGNQGNRVSIKQQPRDRVLGYCWPKGIPLPEVTADQG